MRAHAHAHTTFSRVKSRLTVYETAEHDRVLIFSPNLPFSCVTCLTSLLGHIHQPDALRFLMTCAYIPTFVVVQRLLNYQTRRLDLYTILSSDYLYCDRLQIVCRRREEQ